MAPLGHNSDSPTLKSSSIASNAIEELHRELRADHHELVEGQWHLEELIHQVLFHSTWWEVQVREVMHAAWTLHQAQVSVVELLEDFSRDLTLLELATMYEEAMDVQATLQVYTQCLEALLADPTFHSQYS